jgi:hypothetical protein
MDQVICLNTWGDVVAGCSISTSVCLDEAHDHQSAWHQGIQAKTRLCHCATRNDEEKMA